MSWLREAISDGDGQADVAYISIFMLTPAAIVTIAFICIVSFLDWRSCQPITTISKGDTSVSSVVPCRYDPLPVGQAAGLVFAAYSTLIGALAAYMVATRRQRSAKQTTASD